jgi:hypothetical protein
MKNTPTCLLACLAGVGLLTGCLPEDEPNGHPETAWQNGSRSHQVWSGDPDYPAEGTLPFPSGHGTLPTGQGLSAGDIDCWPISLFDYDTDEWGDVSHFNATLWVSPGDRVLVWWSRWAYGDGDDAVWINEGPVELFIAPDDRMGVFTFELDVNGGQVYSFDIFGSGAEYGFILDPVMN